MQITRATDDAEAQVLALLAAVGDADVTAEDVARIVGLAGAAHALPALHARHLVDGADGRYRVADPVVSADGHDGRAVWMPRVVDHLVGSYERAATDEIVDDLELVFAALDWASAAGRHADVVRLARAVDPHLAVSRRWGAWETVLRRALEAAHAGGDAAGEAWALHQLGTRALGLGDASSAGRHLRSALALRERIGDDRGAAVSRHNLRLCHPAAARS